MDLLGSGMGVSRVNHDRLDVHEFTNALAAQLPTVARLLHSAKRQTRIRSNHTIDECPARLNMRDEQLTFSFIIRPGARSQPKNCIVGYPYCILHAFRAE